MGMKGLSGWLRWHFRGSHVQRLPEYDHVLIDVAPLLYNAAVGRHRGGEASCSTLSPA